MGEPLATNRAQIHLRPSGQVHRPELIWRRHFGGTHQLVGSSTQEVAARLVPKRPTAGRVLGNTYLETGSSFALLGLAQHIAKGIDGQVLTEVRAQVDNACGVGAER